MFLVTSYNGNWYKCSIITFFVDRRCKARQDENPSLLTNTKRFICDDLKILNNLLDHVKESRYLVKTLTKEYLTRSWCLSELHAAITYKILSIKNSNLCDVNAKFKWNMLF